MNKKILVSLIVFALFFATCFCFATDNIVMNLNNSSSSSNNTASNNSANTSAQNTSSQDTVEDNTIYGAQDQTATPTQDSSYSDTSVSTASQYDDSGDLSVTNIINIILIVVGVVLVLLGIAIILRLKQN